MAGAIRESMKHVRRDGRVWVIAVEAPRGHIWIASGTHEYIGASFYTKPTKADVNAALAECFELGSEPCTDPDCDWCNEER